MTNPDEADLRRRVRDLLDAHPPASTERLEFLQAQYDAGLAWVGFPDGLGGLGLPRHLQRVVNEELVAAGAPDNNPRKIGIGLGMAAPTVLAYGTDEQKQRWLRPLWTGEEVWCQLFSEPGAGSDLAALATRQPSPSSPRRSASGMCTSVRKTSLNSASPVIWRSGRTSTPGAVMSQTK